MMRHAYLAAFSSVCSCASKEDCDSVIHPRNQNEFCDCLFKPGWLRSVVA